MAYANTFKRCEMKFLLNESQYELMKEEITRYMTEDTYGLHTIMNIYLDNINDDLIRTSLEKPAYREKLRLRAYGKALSDNAAAFLEIKKKFRGVTYKRRLEGSYGELFGYVSGGSVPELLDFEHKQVFREIDHLVKRLSLIPKVVICYDREAFFGNEDKEFRLTFDNNIRFRRNDVDLRSGDAGEKIRNAPYRIMEVKAAGSVPMWMVRILSENRIYQGSFSKYAAIYLQGQQEKAAALNSGQLTVNSKQYFGAQIYQHLA